MIITEHKGRKMLHVLSRKYRSKWWTLACFCVRPRKDGSCLFTDQAIEAIRPEHRHRVRLAHPKAKP